MRLYWIGVGPKADPWHCSKRKEPQGESPRDDRGRGWSDADTSQGTPREDMARKRQGTDSPSEPPKSHQHRQDLDFGFLALELRENEFLSFQPLSL